MLTAFTRKSQLATHPSRSRLMGHPSRASSQRTQAIRTTIYDRELETYQLDRALKKKPVNILVVLGPRNCGKTAILQSFVEGKRHVVYVDCRSIHSSNPTTFISGLLEKLQPMVPSSLEQQLRDLVLALSADAKLSNQGFTWSLGASPKALVSQGQAGAASASFNKVFQILTEIFAAWEKDPAEPYRPVLVIDEANALMSWTDTYPAELHSLIAFFVRITKQQGQCHVVMATSEYGFQAWLDKEAGTQFWHPRVIGDFPESEARQFLFQQLGGVSSNDDNSIDKDDKTWAAVYEVCGGNAGALACLATELDLTPGRDWEEALKELWLVQLDKVKRLLLGGEGFLAVHYAAAALELLDSQQARNSVELEDMQVLLGRYVEGAASEALRPAAGAAVLERLVQANALSVRPRSNWARDIPVEAFGDDSLVTAPSTMHLFCMRRIRPKLEEVLKAHDSVWKAKQTNPLQVDVSPSSSPVAGPHGEDAGGGAKD